MKKSLYLIFLSVVILCLLNLLLGPFLPCIFEKNNNRHFESKTKEMNVIKENAKINNFKTKEILSSDKTYNNKKDLTKYTKNLSKNCTYTIIKTENDLDSKEINYEDIKIHNKPGKDKFSCDFKNIYRINNTYKNSNHYYYFRSIKSKTNNTMNKKLYQNLKSNNQLVFEHSNFKNDYITYLFNKSTNFFIEKTMISNKNQNNNFNSTYNLPDQNFSNVNTKVTRLNDNLINQTIDILSNFSLGHNKTYVFNSNIEDLNKKNLENNEKVITKFKFYGDDVDKKNDIKSILNTINTNLSYEDQIKEQNGKDNFLPKLKENKDNFLSTSESTNKIQHDFNSHQNNSKQHNKKINLRKKRDTYDDSLPYNHININAEQLILKNEYLGYNFLIGRNLTVNPGFKKRFYKHQYKPLFVTCVKNLKYITFLQSLYLKWQKGPLKLDIGEIIKFLFLNIYATERCLDNKIEQIVKVEQLVNKLLINIKVVISEEKTLTSMEQKQIDLILKIIYNPDKICSFHELGHLLNKYYSVNDDGLYEMPENVEKKINSELYLYKGTINMLAKIQEVFMAEVYNLASLIKTVDNKTNKKLEQKTNLFQNINSFPCKLRELKAILKEKINDKSQGIELTIAEGLQLIDALILIRQNLVYHGAKSRVVDFVELENSLKCLMGKTRKYRNKSTALLATFVDKKVCRLIKFCE